MTFVKLVPNQPALIEKVMGILNKNRGHWFPVVRICERLYCDPSSLSEALSKYNGDAIMRRRVPSEGTQLMMPLDAVIPTVVH